MKVYRVKLGEIDLQIPRSEVVAMKEATIACGRTGYDTMLRVMSHPAAIPRYSLIPGTNVLRWLLNGCIVAGKLILLASALLLFWRLWWWSLGLFVFDFIVINRIQTALNYEIGARLFALDQALDTLEEDKKTMG